MSRRRKRRNAEELRQALLDYLVVQPYPCTTAQIADALDMNWYQVGIHLMRLKEEGRVYHRKLGRQNQWCLMEKYRHGFAKE